MRLSFALLEQWPITLVHSVAVSATVNPDAGRRGYGNPCLTDDQCSSRLGFACITTGAPIASKCQCARETPIFITDTDGVSKCVRVKALYESCMSDLECSYYNPNMQCIDFLCYCPSPYELTENQQCTPRKPSRASVLLTAVPTLLLLLTLLVFGASYSYQRLSRATKDKYSCSGRRGTFDVSTDVEWRPDTVSTASSTLPRHARLSSAFHSKIDPRQHYYLKYGEHASWGYARVPRHPPRYIKRSRDTVDAADTPGSSLFVFKNDSSTSPSDRETRSAASMIAPVHQTRNTPPGLMRTYDDVSVHVLPKYKPAVNTATKACSEGRTDPRQNLDVKRACPRRMAYPKELKDLLHMREVVVSVEPVRSLRSVGTASREISPTFQRRVVSIGSNTSIGRVRCKQYPEQDMRPTLSALSREGTTTPRDLGLCSFMQVPGTDPSTRSQPDRNSTAKLAERSTSQPTEGQKSEICFASTTPFGTFPDTKSSAGESSGINYPHTKAHDTALSSSDSPEKVSTGSENLAGPCSKTLSQLTSLQDETSDGTTLDAKLACDAPIDRATTSPAELKISDVDSSPVQQVESLGSKTDDPGHRPQLRRRSVNSGPENTVKGEEELEEIRKNVCMDVTSPACEDNVRNHGLPPCDGVHKTLVPSERASEASARLSDETQVAPSSPPPLGNEQVPVVGTNLCAQRGLVVQGLNADVSVLDNEITRSFSIEVPPTHDVADVKVEGASPDSEKGTEENISVAEEKLSVAHLRTILSAAEDISVDVTAESLTTPEASICHLSSDDKAGLDNNIDNDFDKDGAKRESESTDWPDSVSRRARESVTESSLSQSGEARPDEITGAFLVRMPREARTSATSKQAEEMVAKDITAINKGGPTGIFAKLLSASYNSDGEFTEPTLSRSSRACSREGVAHATSKETMRNHPVGTTEDDDSSVSTTRSAVSTSSTSEAPTTTAKAKVLFDMPTMLLKSYLQLTESDEAGVGLSGRGSGEETQDQVTVGNVARTASQEDRRFADVHTQTPLLGHISRTSANQDSTQYVRRPPKTNRHADFIRLISLANEHYIRERTTPAFNPCSTVWSETEFIVQRIAYPNPTDEPHTSDVWDPKNACYQYISPEAQPLRLQDIILLQHPIIRTILPQLPSRNVYLRRASQMRMPEALQSRTERREPALNSTRPAADRPNTDIPTASSSETHEPDAPQNVTSGNLKTTEVLLSASGAAEQPMMHVPGTAHAVQSTASSISAVQAPDIPPQSLYTTHLSHDAEGIQIIDAISSELIAPAIPHGTVRSDNVPSTADSPECKMPEMLRSPDSYKARAGPDLTHPGSLLRRSPQQPSSPRDRHHPEISRSSFPTNIEEPCFESVYNAILQSQSQCSSSPDKIRTASPRARPQHTWAQDNSWPQVASTSAWSGNPPGIAPSSQGGETSPDIRSDTSPQQQSPQRRQTNSNDSKSPKGKDRGALPLALQRQAPPPGQQAGPLTIAAHGYHQKEGTGRFDAQRSLQTTAQCGPDCESRLTPTQLSSHREAASDPLLGHDSKAQSQALQSSSCPGFESRQQCCHHDEKHRLGKDDKA